MEEYLLFKIPIDYKNIYDKLLIKLAIIGEDLLKDCSASCTGNNKYVLMCWNMFQCACADYVRNGYETSECKILIKYIINQLNIDINKSVDEQLSFDDSFNNDYN